MAKISITEDDLGIKKLIIEFYLRFVYCLLVL